MYYPGQSIRSYTRWGADHLTERGGIGLSRRMLLVLSAGALAATGLFTSGAAKASTPAASGTPSGGACHLAGNADFGTGLTASSQNFTYSFGGTLDNCQSSDSTATGGTVSAGQVVTINGATYQEPLSNGSGSCSNSTTSGTSIVFWNNGLHTVVNYTTTGAGALVILQGTVAPSITLQSTTGGAPITISSDETATPPGATSLGQLTFSTASPTGVTDCNTATGLTSAVINGLIETGQA